MERQLQASERVGEHAFVRVCACARVRVCACARVRVRVRVLVRVRVRVPLDLCYAMRDDHHLSLPPTVPT